MKSPPPHGSSNLSCNLHLAQTSFKIYLVLLYPPCSLRAYTTIMNTSGERLVNELAKEAKAGSRRRCGAFLAALHGGHLLHGARVRSCQRHVNVITQSYATLHKMLPSIAFKL